MTLKYPAWLFETLNEFHGNGDKYNLLVYSDGYWDIVKVPSFCSTDACLIYGPTLDALYQDMESPTAIIRWIHTYAEGYYMAIGNKEGKSKTWHNLHRFWGDNNE